MVKGFPEEEATASKARGECKLAAGFFSFRSLVGRSLGRHAGGFLCAAGIGALDFEATAGNFVSDVASERSRFVDTLSGATRIGLAPYPIRTDSPFFRLVLGTAVNSSFGRLPNRKAPANWQTMAKVSSDGRNRAEACRPFSPVRRDRILLPVRTSWRNNQSVTPFIPPKSIGPAPQARGCWSSVW